MSGRSRSVSPRLRVVALAVLVALTSFVVEAAPTAELGLGPDSALAPLDLGPDPVRAGWCASNPEFKGRLTASSSSTTAVNKITNPTVYGYISNIDKAWSCNIYFRYSALTWNTSSSAGTYVWGALIASASTPCNWVVNTNDYLKANSTSSCPTSISQHAMSINLNPEGIYTNNNNHSAFGHFGFAHSDCGTWYGNKVTKTGASYSTSATNNRPGSNCDPITLEGTNTSQTVTYDKTPPTGSININSGAAATNSTAVTLNLSATDAVSGVYQRRFSNDGSSWTAWEAYGTSKAWTLPGGDGQKTVYVRYRDNNLNVSTTYSKSIILDTVAPTVDFTTPNEGTTTIQKTTSYQVAWTENGTGSAIASRSLQRQRGTIATPSSCAGVSWSNDGSATGGASPRNETGLLNGYCYRWRLTVTDQAGNTSALRTSGSVLVDTAAPTVDFTTPNENTTVAQGGLSYTVAWTENGTGTNITGRSLQRQKAAITSAGQCPTNGWSNENSPYTGTSPRNETGLQLGFAYRWVQTLTDQATNQGAGTSGCLLIEELPSAQFSVPPDGLSFANTTSIDVTWTEDAAGGSITARSLQMESGAVEVPGTCDDVDWQPDGSPTSATSPVTFNDLASGSCYRWTQTLTNQSSLQGSTTSGEVLIDSDDPVAEIAFPENGRPLAGTVGVSGTAADALSYEIFTLEYGAGVSPTAWSEIQADGAAVDDDELAAWATEHLQGVYTLRLTVTDLAGNSAVASRLVYLENSRRGEDSFRTRVPFDLGGGWQMGVGVANGELTLERHLFEIPSFGPPQSLSLSYSSQNDSAAGMFGTGWSSNLTQHLTFEDGFVVWHRADGGLVPFGLVDSAWVPLAGHHETLSQDTLNNRYTITARDQSRLVFEDAGAGRLTRIENRFGKALTLSWGSTSATASDASSQPRTTSITISGGRITQVTDSAGRSWSFAYTNGNLTTVTDPLSHATTLAYGSAGLSGVTRTRSRVSGSPETITWSVGYDEGRVASVTDPESPGPANTFEYDRGQATVGLLKQYSPLVRNTWLYDFDELGRVTAILDPEGYTTGYTWDGDSNLLELVLPIDTEGAWQTITYTYDERGNMLSQTTQLTETEFVVTRMSYNATNDLLIRSEADGSSVQVVTRYTYDGAGRLTSVNENCTTSGTTPPDPATDCTGAGTQNNSTNLVTSFTYTANGQLEHETDPLGRVIRHVYDAHGNEIETIQNYHPGQSANHERNVSSSFAYDQGTAAGKAGLPTSSTDPVGNTATFAYDALGRQTSESLPGDPSIPALTRSTTYDELGNVLTEDEAWGTVTSTTTHVYDLTNRETLMTDPALVESSTSYDAAGNAISTTAGGVTTARQYDGLGRVTGETVAGATTTHAYDGQGRDVATEDPEGVTTVREYDLGGRVRREATETDDGELATTYEYDLLSRVSESTTPDGVVTETTYDGTGRVKSVTEADATTTHDYDRAGNVISTTAPDETVTTTTYDPLDRPTVVVANYVNPPTSPAVATENVTTTTFYDAAGRTVAFRDAQGSVATSAYNVRGLVATSIANCTEDTSNPSPPTGADWWECDGSVLNDGTWNVLSTYSYDGSGATLLVLVAEGIGGVEATFQYAHDGAGRRIATRDPLGTVTRTLYDAEGRVWKTIANCTEDSSNPQPPSGSWWECDGSTINDGTWNLVSLRSYDARGNLASETAPNGRKTSYVYDDADRLVERIDNDVAGSPGPNEDLSTFYAYDAAGRQNAVMAPTADRTTYTVTRFFFNEQGQLVKEIRNCLAQGVSAYSPASAAWKTCIDTDAVHDAETNLVTEYEYDERGNRTAVIAADPSAGWGSDVATVITRFAYDTSNRLCGVLQNATIELAANPCATDPGIAGTPTENVWTAYAYDGLGSLASMTDGQGNTTLYGYDSMGRMVTLTDPLGNTTTWTYDELGRRTVQSQRGTGSQPTLISWTYDAAGRVLTRTAHDPTPVTTTYTYDLLGNRLTAQTGSEPKITTTYDRLGRPLTVTVQGDGAATTTYTYSLTAPSWTDPSGSYAATLDAFDRQVSLLDPVNGSTAWSFAYRADGLPASIGAPNGNTTTFSYDPAGNQTGKDTSAGSTLRVGYEWTHNRAGQVLSEEYTLGTDQPIIAEYSYDALSRLETWARDGVVTTYGWQAVPNRDSVQVASDPALTTSFNAANRPTSDSASGTYGHDVEGRMIARPGQVLAWDDLGRLTTVTDGSTTIAAYTYDALDRLYTVTRSGSTIRFRYVGLTTQVAQVVDQTSGTAIRSFANDWTGSRLLDWTGSGSNLRYYGTNAHHDVSWTAGDSGAVSATLRYDPWGIITSSTGSSLPDHRFQGSWFDTASELYWVVARWYAPSLGRFVSEDSLLGQPEDPPSRHLYAYGAGDCVNNIDQDGRLTEPIHYLFMKGKRQYYHETKSWLVLPTARQRSRCSGIVSGVSPYRVEIKLVWFKFDHKMIQLAWIETRLRVTRSDATAARGRQWIEGHPTSPADNIGKPPQPYCEAKRCVATGTRSWFRKWYVVTNFRYDASDVWIETETFMGVFASVDSSEGGSPGGRLGGAALCRRSHIIHVGYERSR